MQFDKLLNKRRALRSLAPIEINDEMVNKLAKAASLAPSCFNNQPWRFVFVRDSNNIDKIIQAMPSGNQSWAKDAAMIIGVVAKQEDDCVLGDRKYFLFDTGLATQNILLKATELDLVAHPIAGYDKAETMQILDIPKDYNLITLIVVGKKAEQINQDLSEQQQNTEKQRPPRKDLPEIAFYESFGE